MGCRFQSFRGEQRRSEDQAGERERDVGGSLGACWRLSKIADIRLSYLAP
jgi:hypothetical protein